MHNTERANFHHLVMEVAWFGLALATTSRFLSVFAIRLGRDPGRTRLDHSAALRLLTRLNRSQHPLAQSLSRLDQSTVLAVARISVCVPVPSLDTTIPDPSATGLVDYLGCTGGASTGDLVNHFCVHAARSRT